MEVWILDGHMNNMFETIDIIDKIESLIWTERYSSCGDFELYTPFDKKSMDIMQKILKNLNSTQYADTLAWLPESETYMIIENVQVTTDVEASSKLVLSGRSLESILDRRIVWEQTLLNGSLESGIFKLLKENFMAPSSIRYFPRFNYVSQNNKEISKMKLATQYTGDNIYDIIVNLCDIYDVGFKIFPDEKKRPTFMLYKGVDRSYDQNDNPYVIFSPKFENLSNSDMLISDKNNKNVTLVAGEGEGLERRTVEVNKKGYVTAYYSRKELYTDARDIQSDTGDEQLSDEEYSALLTQRGLEKLNDYSKINAYTAEAIQTKNFIYEKDFFKGDIVQLENEYGMTTKAKVSEIIRSIDNSGYNVYPTFVNVE